MAVEASGSQTCTVGTEHTLHSITAEKTIIVTINLLNAADGATPDIFVIRIYASAADGGTKYLQREFHFVGKQGSGSFGSSPLGTLIKDTVPVKIPYEGEVTLEQVQGTSRSVPWHVTSI